MENVRKYIELTLATSPDKLNKKVANPRYEGHKIFSEDLAAIKSLKKKVRLNKPIYTGFTVLDLSKFLMYDFHYGFMVKEYGVKAKLCFSDTDSLLYDVETEDIYVDMLAKLHLFDTSGYFKDHLLYSDMNKKVNISINLIKHGLIFVNI